MLTLEAIRSALEALKAENIQALHLPPSAALCDAMLICTARSSTHARALAGTLHDLAKAHHHHIRTEGLEHPEWVLVDFGDYLVHIMLEPTRQYYQLEALWS